MEQLKVCTFNIEWMTSARTGRRPAHFERAETSGGVRKSRFGRSWLSTMLCRYITRPALLDERVQLNAAGHLELKLKTPWRDGTTHLVMTPLEFM